MSNHNSIVKKVTKIPQEMYTYTPHFNTVNN